MRLTEGPNVDVFFVALSFADGTVGVMQFITAEYNKDGTKRWERLATADAVDKEIERSNEGFPKEKLPVQSWRFVEFADIPKDRTYREAWVDSGTAITVDPVKAALIDAAKVTQPLI